VLDQLGPAEADPRGHVRHCPADPGQCRLGVTAPELAVFESRSRYSGTLGMARTCFKIFASLSSSVKRVAGRVFLVIG
jgi:hypothetical protein